MLETTKESTETEAQENLESGKANFITEIPREDGEPVTTNSRGSDAGEEPDYVEADFNSETETENSEIDTENSSIGLTNYLLVRD